MKKVRPFLFAIVSLLGCNQLIAQKDSVQALFKAPTINIHYSYLQWEVGYQGLLFNNTYLQGISLDLFGIVFNDDYDLAFGFDQAGSNGGRTRGNAIVTTMVQSYSSFYFKFMPMLSPEKIINLAMPIKFNFASMSYPDTSTINTGYGRHNRRKSVSYPSVEPGLAVCLNVFPKVNLGVGVSYRVALQTASGISTSDYNNFDFSAFIRFKVFTRNPRNQAAKKNNYYDQPNRFQ